MVLGKELRMEIDRERQERSRKREEHMESKLDEALKETFPASDPFAITPFSPAPRKHRGPRPRNSSQE